MRATLFGLILITAAGCGANDSHAVALDAPLRVRVDGAAVAMARVHLDGATGVVTPSGPVIGRAAGDAAAGATNDLAFEPAALTFDLQTRDDSARAGALRLPLGDLRVFAPSLPAAGLQLRDLALRLPEATKLDIVRSSATSLTLATTTMLALDWKMELADGSRYALGPLPIGPVELHVAVTEDDAGALTLQLFTMCPDGCGGIDGLFTLADGMVWLRADASAD